MAAALCWTVEGLKLKVYVNVVNGDVVTIGLSTEQEYLLLHSFTPYSAKARHISFLTIRIHTE